MTSIRLLNGFDVSKGNFTYPTVVPCSTGNVIIEMTAAERCNLVYQLENPIMATAHTEPIVHPEYPKQIKDHIWEISEGVFDFTDETEDFAGGRYPTIEAAKATMDDYCYWLDREAK